MKRIQLAKSQESFELLDQWHSRFESKLEFASVTHRVETSFGFTDVMTTGDSESSTLRTEPPLFIIHGATAGAPFALGEIGDLPSRRQIYAVNVPGQSTRAAQIRLDFKTDEYAGWFGEILDHFNVDQVVLCGISWGGSVALRVAKHLPKRLRGLVLVVPGSIVNGSVWEGIRSMALPIFRYKLFPNDKNRDRALRNIVTSHDELWSPYLGDSIRHWKVDFSVPPLVIPSDFNELTSPVYVFAADEDVSFPGQPLIERCEQLFPNLVGSHLLANSKHCPSFQPSERQKFTKLFEEALTKIEA